MTEMTPETHERLWHEWYALWHDADASQPKASYEEWLESHIEALEKALAHNIRERAIRMIGQGYRSPEQQQPFFPDEGRTLPAAHHPTG